MAFVESRGHESTLGANMSETTLSFFKVEGTESFHDRECQQKDFKNPEVTSEKASRRRFTAEYKRRISLEAERCTQPGEIGALLRREGLYSSVVAALASSTSGGIIVIIEKVQQQTVTAKPSSAKELASLKRENERLKEKLRQAELIIEVQKKVSEMMQTRSPEKTD